jgi:hypothetical protein
VDGTVDDSVDGHSTSSLVRSTREEGLSVDPRWDRLIADLEASADGLAAPLDETQISERIESRLAR